MSNGTTLDQQEYTDAEIDTRDAATRRAENSAAWARSMDASGPPGPMLPEVLGCTEEEVPARMAALRAEQFQRVGWSSRQRGYVEVTPQIVAQERAAHVSMARLGAQLERAGAVRIGPDSYEFMGQPVEVLRAPDRPTAPPPPDFAPPPAACGNWRRVSQQLEDYLCKQYGDAGYLMPGPLAALLGELKALRGAD